MLNFKISSIDIKSDHVLVTGGNYTKTFKSKYLIIASDYEHLLCGHISVKPQRFINRGVIICDKGIGGSEESSVFVVPPTEDNNGIFCKQTSHESYCPSSKCKHISY